MVFERRGALVVPDASFSSTLEKKLTVTGVDYMGKEFSYTVFHQTQDRVHVPRYILGVEAAVLSASRAPRENRDFPTFRGSLWPEQMGGAEEAFSYLKTEHGVFLKADPGSGKTVAALWLASVTKPNRVIVLVDQNNLADQWCQRIKESIPEATVTFVMPLSSQRALHKKHDQRRMLSGIERHDLRGDFVICMTQSLVSHPKELQADMLIVDECHVFSAPTFSNAIFYINFFYSLALSANETRADGLEWVFRDMLGATKVEMKGKRLPARAQFYPVNTQFLRWGDPMVWENNHWFHKAWCTRNQRQTTRYDCSHCPVVKDLGTSEMSVLTKFCASLWKSDEWDENSLERHLGMDSEYVGWILDTIDTFLQAGRDIFVFCRLRAPLEYLHKVIEISLGNVSGLYLGSATNERTRRRNERALTQPITLCTYQKAGKGLDVARKDGVLFASPVSKNKLNQVIGRVERSLSGKKRPVAIHPVVPFVTSKARMRGCVNWYMENQYDCEIHPTLSRYLDSQGR